MTDHSSPESRVFILVALARVSASNALTRASATRIKTRDSGLLWTDSNF